VGLEGGHGAAAASTKGAATAKGTTGIKGTEGKEGATGTQHAGGRALRSFEGRRAQVCLLGVFLVLQLVFLLFEANPATRLSSVRP